MIRSSPSRQALFLFLALDYDDRPETRHLPADPRPMNDLNHIGHVLLRFAYLLIHRASVCRSSLWVSSILRSAMRVDEHGSPCSSQDLGGGAAQSHTSKRPKATAPNGNEHRLFVAFACLL